MADDNNSVRPDGEFFRAANEYLELARKQTESFGVNRASIVGLFAVARFGSHVFLGTIPPPAIPANRTAWLDHTTDLFRRMLNEQLDALGQERGIDVGVSELATAEAAPAEAAAAPTSAANDVAAAGAMPPSNDPLAR